MKAISLYIVICALLLSVTTNAQVKHAATATVKVYGNCDECKSAIEAAAAKGKHASASWNSDNHTAVITYDSTRTTLPAVLKQIALAGYDNEQFLAPDNAYTRLPACCQYERTTKKAIIATPDAPAMHTTEATAAVTTHALTAAANAYFELKEALVNSSSPQAATKAKALQEALKAVAMNQLAPEQHIAWMQEKNTLFEEANSIATLTDIEKQRIHFSTLSNHFYTVVKAGGIGQTIYYQHCPMFNGGADWLSKESAIRNPFYGNEMLSCGKTKATIQ